LGMPAMAAKKFLLVIGAMIPYQSLVNTMSHCSQARTQSLKSRITQ